MHVFVYVHLRMDKGLDPMVFRACRQDPAAIHLPRQLLLPLSTKPYP